jgi:Kef-type K+ transport system membrane component KefB
VFALAKGEHTTLVVLTIALLVGLAAHALGFHPAVGAYMAGLVLKEEYFLLLDSPEIDHFGKIKTVVNDIAFSWIGPIFFIDLGSKIIFDREILLSVIPEIIALSVSLFVIQVSSAGLAARYTGSFTWQESLMIGFGMLGRAELAFVVMDIAYVQNPILSEEAFFTLMATAFWLNVSVPITIAFWKPYFSGNRRLFGQPSHLP